MLRTHTCGEINLKSIGKNVKLCGWVDNIRKLGKIIFLDLRDRYGVVQCVVKNKNVFNDAQKLTKESCVFLKGKIIRRKKENKELDSGKVELDVSGIEIFSISDVIPFAPKNATEDTRLKYRYLDLRFNSNLRKNLELRHKIIQAIRDFLSKKDFLEVQTPILTKSSPEGARDFIVPSRIHKGKFYALPQSPQQYKQLLMIAGMDKYFQIAPCFRDEDPRADRSPGEFYQLDLEMSFAEQNDILNVIEKMFIQLVKNVFPEKKITKIPFPRISYEEAMKKYKSDKPDLRKNKKNSDELSFVWVVDFPLFEEKLEKGNYAPMHHMFTMPKKEHHKYLNKKDAKKAKSYQHDLVLNGFEIGGGSVRIHIPDVQEKIFDLIGFSTREKKYFSHMLKAFTYGAPPHGGIALGLDRLIMVLLGEPNLRETIAFPKNKEAKDLVIGAPDDVSDEQLKEANINLGRLKDK